LVLLRVEIAAFHPPLRVVPVEGLVSVALILPTLIYELALMARKLALGVGVTHYAALRSPDFPPLTF